MALKSDYKSAVTQYRKGYSIEQVAKSHGVSRQAMYQILKRRGVVFRPRCAPRKAVQS